MIQQDWTTLKDAPIDTFEIEMKVRDFYLGIDYEADVMEKIFEAKHILSSARILIVNLIDPQDNGYIKEYLESYNWMIENIGRIDRFFDELEEKTLSRREMSISIKPEDYPKESFTIVNYVRKLDVLMQHLVYYPLKNAYLRFQKPFYKEGKEISKDEKLFCYLVFSELFKSSHSLGNIMYEKKKTTQQQTYEPPSQEIIPDEIPKNVKVKEEPMKPQDIKIMEPELKNLEDEDENISEEED